MFRSIAQGDTIEQAAENADIVTMGINPSKSELHQGHYLTLYQALCAVLCREQTHGVFFVDDREFHSNSKPAFDGRLHLPGEYAVASVEAHMKSFIEQMAKALHASALSQRITVMRMSDYLSEQIQDTSHGGELHKVLWEHRAKIERMFEFDENEPNSRFMIRPACPRCEYIQCVESNILAEQHRIVSLCSRFLCNQRTYTVRTAMGENNWAMHYTVDPIRDVLLAKEHDARILHVFGGDYGQQWGRGRTSKAKRLSTLLPQLAPRAHVDHFVGPLLTYQGEKLAKSNGDASQPPSLHILEEMIRRKVPILDLPLATTSTPQELQFPIPESVLPEFLRVHQA